MHLSGRLMAFFSFRRVVAFSSIVLIRFFRAYISINNVHFANAFFIFEWGSMSNLVSVYLLLYLGIFMSNWNNPPMATSTIRKNDVSASRSNSVSAIRFFLIETTLSLP